MQYGFLRVLESVRASDGNLDFVHRVVQDVASRSVRESILA